MAITILATDRNLVEVGDPISGWTDLDVTLRFNEPGSGTMTCPRSALTTAQLAPGNRLVVIRDGEVFCAGPIEKPGPERWSVSDADSGPGVIEVSFTEDLALIAGDLAYPDPANAVGAQSVARRTFTATNAEDVMRSLVAENVGPTAVLTARRIPELVLGADNGLGSNVTMGFRMTPLGDALRSVAIAGGGLGFRTTQVDSTIEFQVYDPQDLTGQVRFSRALGNLRAYNYDPEAPTATVAIVGDGTGEGTTRVFYEYTDPAVSTWWRVVTFVDRRDTTDVTEIAAAGAEAIARGAAKARLSTVTVDTATQRYGEHYNLGDLVSVELNSGVELADVVRAVNLQATPNDGELVTPTVGSQDVSNDPEWVQITRNLAQRLGRLEAI